MSYRKCSAKSNIFIAATLALLGSLACRLLAESPATPPADATEPRQSTERPADKAGDVDEPSAPSHPFEQRVPAPSLDGGKEWLNVAGPISLRDLRGKFVVLDFWTYCCINCMHILPELKKLEHAYPNEIVVIGVHSAKFEAEKGTENIRQAILRYDIEHPVINDADHVVWRRYGISGWPALRVIDPEGKLVAVHGGEIDFQSMNQFFKNALPYYKKHGLLDETPVRFDLERQQEPARPLKFPGKILADESSQRLYISDSGHHRIVVADLDGNWIENIGSGAMGADDGSYEKATFDHPQGMALDGKTLYVADTENHTIRRVNLDTRQVSTIAGTGVQNRGQWPGLDRIKFGKGAAAPEFPERWFSDARKIPLASPWALLVRDGYLYIAMAGRHQLWRMSLDKQEIEVYSGNGREDIADGFRVPQIPPRIDRVGFQPGYASFAQPSGLATDGEWLYVADSEGSAVRAVPFANDKKVTTVVGPSNLPGGKSLFSFGDQDGEANDVRLQHVLGITYHDRHLYVADTYNNKIKVIDIDQRTATTLAGDGKPDMVDEPPRFDEPEGLSYADGKLYVADTNNHAIRVVDLENSNRVSTLAIKGLKPPRPAKSAVPASFPNARRLELEPVTVRPVDGNITLSVDLALPVSWKINTLAPLRYQLAVKQDDGPVDRDAIGKSVVLPAGQRRSRFEINVPVTSNEGSDQLQLSLTCYYCRDGAEGLCKVASVVWSIPIELAATATPSSIPLRHAIK